MSDLAVACYGDKVKLPMDFFILAVQFSFLFAYNIFLGDQLDQILCKIFMVAECGNSTMYKVLINIALLPLLFQKSLKNIAIFSMFALVTSLLTITIVLGLEGEIKSHSYAFIQREMSLHLDDNDFNYKYIEWANLPIVASTFMALYEGNSIIISIYAETAEPKHFVRDVILGYSVVASLAILLGYFSYLTLGDKITDIILLVLPTNSHWAVTGKIMYLFTIMGSYVLNVQPLFNIVENFQSFKEFDLVGEDAKYYLERTSVVALSIIGAILLPNVNLVLQFTGSIGGTLIGAVLPTMLYHKAYAVASSRDEYRYVKPQDWKRNLVSYLVFLFGTAIGLVGLGASIYDLAVVKPVVVK